METIKTKAYGTGKSLINHFNNLERMDIERPAPQADEVLIDILYCGVCHSDVHQVKNDWGNTVYPCIPGHEIIGRVTVAGSNVTKFKVGDIVGVGCMVDSCNQCKPCQTGEENYCQGPVSWTATYNGYMKPPKKGEKYNTFGGYSENIVVKEHFVLKIPDNLDIKSAAPILCSGITTYSPLKHWGVKEGSRVGVAGLGGLGHMAVKLAAAMGAEVTVLTTKEEKEADAKKFGAHRVILSTDTDAMEKAKASLDFLLITIPDAFDITPYVCLMDLDGAIVTVGLLGEYKKPINNMDFAMSRLTIGGSVIGGIKETQEVLDFCAAHNILPDTEMIKIQDINNAYDEMLKEEVHYRYVIDMQSLKEEA